LLLQGSHAVTEKNGHVHEGRIDRFKLPHTTVAAYGTCEHELNLTALQTSEVDPHQQNGGCVRFGNLSHNKLVNERLRIVGSQQIGERVNFGYWGQNKLRRRETYEQQNGGCVNTENWRPRTNGA